MKKALKLATSLGVIVDRDGERELSMPALRTLSLEPLHALADAASVAGVAAMRVQDVVMAVARAFDDGGTQQFGEGCLEVLPDGFGFLRAAEHNYLPCPYDIYMSPSQIRRFALRTGDTVAGRVRPPKDSERFYALLEVSSINGCAPEEATNKPFFENLTPLYPDEQLHLEFDSDNIPTRVLDLFTPLGKGQRALIVAPPRAGKTMLMQGIANAITQQHPDVTMMVLLIDERPEEVTDMQRQVDAEVISSTFDEPAERHVAVAEMVIERAKRLV
ncbi:MAG: transcription termination factor Rho, partial [Bradymonadia bacterium]